MRGVRVGRKRADVAPGEGERNLPTVEMHKNTMVATGAPKQQVAKHE
jgi:hypothetical protein